MRRLLPAALAICVLASAVLADRFLVNDQDDVVTYFAMRDSSTGAGKTGLTPTDFDLQYVEEAQNPSTKADATAGSLTAHGDNTVVEVDATDQPGLYKIDWPDAAFDGGAGKTVILTAKCSGAFTEHLIVHLSAPVDAVAISGDTTAADNAELMFDGTGYAGGAVKLGVDAVAISGDATAADNAELMFDGTGYAGGSTKLGVDTVAVSGDTEAADRLEIALDGTYATANATVEGGTPTYIRDNLANWPGVAVGDWVCWDTAGAKEFRRVYALDPANYKIVVSAACTPGAGKVASVGGLWKMVAGHADLRFILSKELTESSAGRLADNFKKFFDVSNPTGDLNSLPAAVPGAAGGLLIAGANAATTVNITGTFTGDLTGKVLGGGSGTITGTGVRAVDSSGNAIAPASTALSNVTWTDALAGYVGKLNVSGTLAHTDNAASFKATGFSTHAAADVAALILADPDHKIVVDGNGFTQADLRALCGDSEQGTLLNAWVGTDMTSFTAARGGYLDKLNVSGTLAHTANAAWWQAANRLTNPAGNVWHVTKAGNDTTGDGTAAAPYLTVAKAAAVASSGDEIRVGPGTFSEAVDASAITGLTIRGAGRSTILTADSATAVLVMGPDAVLRDLSVVNSRAVEATGTACAVKVTCSRPNSATVWIENVRAESGRGIGIQVGLAQRTVLRDCYGLGSEYGIFVTDAPSGGATWHPVALLERCTAVTKNWETCHSAAFALWYLRRAVMIDCVGYATRPDTSSAYHATGLWVGGTQVEAFDSSFGGVTTGTQTANGAFVQTFALAPTTRLILRGGSAVATGTLAKDIETDTAVQVSGCRYDPATVSGTVTAVPPQHYLDASLASRSSHTAAQAATAAAAAILATPANLLATDADGKVTAIGEISVDVEEIAEAVDTLMTSSHGSGEWTGGDPWTTVLPGSYGAGTAGKLLSGTATAADVAITVTPLAASKPATRVGGAFRLPKASAETVAWSLVDSTGAAINLTGYALKFQVYTAAGAKLFERTSDSHITITDAEAGQLTVTFTAANLAASGTSTYELWGTKGASTTLLVSGPFVVEKTLGP